MHYVFKKSDLLRMLKIITEHPCAHMLCSKQLAPSLHMPRMMHPASVISNDSIFKGSKSRNKQYCP